MRVMSTGSINGSARTRSPERFQIPKPPVQPARARAAARGLSDLLNRICVPAEPYKGEFFGPARHHSSRHKAGVLPSIFVTRMDNTTGLPTTGPVAAPPLPELLEHQRHNNRTSLEDWQRFAGHRARVTDLVLTARGGSLAVLGAGNCNDLELEQVAEAFQAIHLVDLDEEAVQGARRRQPEAVAAKLMSRAPIDLSGAFAELPQLRGKTVSAAKLEALSQTALDKVTAALPERFDTVLSACVLSQIMFSAYVALGSHPQLAQIGSALAVAHLRALRALTRPGGRVLFVTDTVSSKTYPLRERWDEQPPLTLLAQLNQTNNVFSGTALPFVRRVLATEASFFAESPLLLEPWLWDMNDDTTLLVYAVVLKLRSA
jgi:hypothetical protein